MDSVWPIMDDFFAEVLDYLGYNNPKAIQVFTAVEPRVLESPEFVHGTATTDDFMKMLVARDIIVASMIACRSRSNYTHCMFAHYLDTATIRRAKWEPRP